MAGVLIAMRVAVLRHSLRGARAAWTSTGALVGLGLAVATIVSGRTDGTLLASLWGTWAIGWAVAPLVSGGGEVLKPENFAMLPMSPRRLASGLLASSFVGFGPAVTLVAFASLLPYAVHKGPVALVVAVPALLLELVFVVLLARFVNAVAGMLLRTRVGAFIVALVWAGSMALIAQGWALVAALTQRWGDEGPAYLRDVVGWLPSGWPIRAVDAAARGDWGVALGVLAALAVLPVLMLLGWSRLLQRRLTEKPARPSERRASSSRLGRIAYTGRVGAVAAKELRSWSRDLLRTNHLWFAVIYAVGFCLLPVLVGWWGMAPYTGLAMLLMGSGLAANIYGLDGTALWLTLLTPGAARADVRGRQLAWVTVMAPMAIGLSVAFTVLSGDSYAWPIVVSLLPAVLGGAAGLIALVSTHMLVPMTDPHKRGSNPLGISDNDGSSTGLAYLMLGGVPVTALPAGAVAAAGVLTDRPWLAWLGLPTGLVTGAFFAWLGGRLAHRRLDAHGPELLEAMRTGVAPATRKVTGKDGVERLMAAKGLDDLPKRLRVIVGVCWSVCWLPIFPQGLVALGFVLFGQERHSWFLATYVGGWGVPLACGMVVFGLAVLGTGIYLPGWYRKREAVDAV
ncbi:transporter [Actinorhabdospora filicis]|uniref:Transporter n=1 Tax=Actinorhabdospora filicis TaxID=1785913 RepID=A0A9W6SL80_9ACTN|nr:hypothetical protein [Actinorhabdospora filicis]GLZ77754.1 transporter [Actinorhabdospora filicis]